MKVTSSAPAPTYRLEFNAFEGWAVVAALRDYADRHPQAACVKEWELWADALARELRK